MRRLWLTLLLFGVGCQSFSPRQEKASIDPVAHTPSTPSTLNERPMLQTLKELEQDTLKQSAALVDQQQEAAACKLLSQLVAKYPDRSAARLAYADLLLQMKQTSEARAQYEQLLEIRPSEEPDSARLLLRSHSQLADIAEGLHDAYSEHLHRGIGHYLMARHFPKGVSVGGTLVPSETLLTKAQNELTQAIEMRPDEARPSWYLYGVHLALGQKEAAERFLRLAQQSAAHSRLTRQERRGIEVAVRGVPAETSRR